MEGIIKKDILFDRQKKGFNCSIDSLINFNSPDIKQSLLSNSPIFDFIKKEKIRKILNRNFKDNITSKFLFNFITTKFFLEANY